MPSPPVPAAIDEFLREAHPAVMATLREDGSPHSAATWYDWENGELLLNVAETRRRLAWMKPGAHVALTVLDKEDWYRHVSLSGRIARLVEDEGLRDIDRLSLRYFGKPYATRDQRRLTGWMAVESWHAWDHGRLWAA